MALDGYERLVDTPVVVGQHIPDGKTHTNGDSHKQGDSHSGQHCQFDWTRCMVWVLSVSALLLSESALAFGYSNSRPVCIHSRPLSPTVVQLHSPPPPSVRPLMPRSSLPDSSSIGSSCADDAKARVSRCAASSAVTEALCWTGVVLGMIPSQGATAAFAPACLAADATACVVAASACRRRLDANGGGDGGGDGDDDASPCVEDGERTLIRQLAAGLAAAAALALFAGLSGIVVCQACLSGCDMPAHTMGAAAVAPFPSVSSHLPPAAVAHPAPRPSRLLGRLSPFSERFRHTQCFWRPPTTSQPRASREAERRHAESVLVAEPLASDEEAWLPLAAASLATTASASPAATSACGWEAPPTAPLTVVTTTAPAQPLGEAVSQHHAHAPDGDTDEAARSPRSIASSPRTAACALGVSSLTSSVAPSSPETSEWESDDARYPEWVRKAAAAVRRGQPPARRPPSSSASEETAPSQGVSASE